MRTNITPRSEDIVFVTFQSRVESLISHMKMTCHVNPSTYVRRDCNVSKNKANASPIQLANLTWFGVMAIEVR